MRTLCSIDAIAWEYIPDQNTLAGIPLSFYEDLIDYILEREVAPLLQDHCCEICAPCSVLRKAMRTCLPYLSVCKQWKTFVSLNLACHPYRILKRPVPDLSADPSNYTNSYDVGTSCSLSGRYRGHKSIERDYRKSVLEAYDYGGPDGCHGKVEVVIKISSAREEYKTENDVYTWLTSVKSRAPYVPHLYFAGHYDHQSRYYGLVLAKLGPDLEALRQSCRQERFTPRMTMAAAIQMIGIYEMFHSQGWLHCNAKPGNFAISPDIPSQNSRIMMIDFEFSQRIMPYPDIQRSAIEGWNVRFRPVNLELGLTPSCREDLEGLGFVFSYLERGCLAWQHASRDEIWRQKLRTSTDKLFEGMDPAYCSYFNDVKALFWGERPKYNILVQRFVEAWEKMGYLDSPHEIDWWNEFQLRKKIA